MNERQSEKSLTANRSRLLACSELRAHVLYGLWTWGAETELLRGVVATVWQHDYREMLAAFQRRQIRALFDAARFPIDHLPERVTIYRGIATKGSERPTHSGIAWTLRRDLACWFALHLPGPGGSAMFHIPPGWTPHLLTATVPRKRVAAHLRDRNEDENYHLWDVHQDGQLDERRG
jgi:hypothetical protein